MKLALYIPLALALILSVLLEAEAIRVRCGILSFFGNDRACRASCWVRGKRSGVCDEDNNCVCSKTGLDIPDSVKDILGGLDVLDWVKQKISEFEEGVSNWEITEEVKALVPSRCRLGDGFCESSCHAIGRVTGECNQDYSDCACSDDTVSPKEFALCVEDGICSVYCQKKDFATGDCRGENGWDCQCITLDGKKEIQSVPVVDMDEYEDFNN